MRNAWPSDLIDLCAVVEHGGLGAAARALGRPKSSLSLAVRRLEDNLSVRLVDRTKRRFDLTERGRTLYESIAPLLGQVDRITSDFRASSGQIVGSLRIAAPYEFGAHHLALVARDLVARNPQLAITVDVQYAPVRELLAGGYDVVFVMTNGKLTDPGLVTCRMFLLERALFASPAFLDQHPPIRRPEDLAQLALIASSQDLQWRFADADGRTIEVPIPDSPIRSSNASIRKQAAIGGFGITRTVATFCRDEVRSGLLRKVLPSFRCTPLSVYAVINERRLMPAPVKALFEELERVAPDLFIEMREPVEAGIR
ncbi:MAG: LysR family transcriptional regulator [Burkholderiaceae bacterium]|nr:LysR family transcriptional regulator [Burkholderiaceae bacterium]